MKKWDKPQVAELGLQNTEDLICNYYSGDTNGTTVYTPNINGNNANMCTGKFEAGDNGVTCRFFSKGKCQYPGLGGQS